MRHLAIFPMLAAALAGAHAAPMAAHRAVYTLSLDTSRNADVVAAHGTMTYDVLDTCSAWTTAQHLVIDLTNKDGQDVHMVSDYATLESKDAMHLDFHTKQVTEQAVTEQLDGTAALEHRGGRGHADFTSPQKTQALLPEGTLLPMAHTNALLDAAAAGKKFLSAPLFDGTGADGAQDTFVTIETWSPPGGAGNPPGGAGNPPGGAGNPPGGGASVATPTQKWAALAALPSGRIHIAFFDRSQAAETPSYEIGMTYYANGVADGLAMNFGNFTMGGRLDQLDLHPSPHCQ